MNSDEELDAKCEALWSEYGPRFHFAIRADPFTFVEIIERVVEESQNPMIRRDSLIWERWQQGFTARQIAEEFNLKPNRIRALLRTPKN